MPEKDQPPPERSKNIEMLRHQLDSLMFMGSWGVAIVDGTGQEIYSRNPEQRFFAASVNKLLAAVYVFGNGMAYEHVSLSDPLEGGGMYDKGNQAEGQAGSEIAAGIAVEDSIQYSGNTAAKSLIMHFRADNINAFARKGIGTEKTYVEQSSDGTVSFGQTTAADIIRLLQYVGRYTPYVVALLKRSTYQKGLRKYLPPARQNDLVVGSKYGAVNEMGVRHEVGLIERENYARPEDSLRLAVLSQTPSPKLYAANTIAMIGANIYEHYFGYKAVPMLGRLATGILAGGHRGAWH